MENQFGETIKIVFVSGFYDKPLSGLCRVDGKMHEFISDYERDDCITIPLSNYQKVKWYIRKWSFEWCVGTHWTYKNGIRTSYFYWRTPKFLHLLLFNLYYRISCFSKKQFPCPKWVWKIK